MHKGFHNTTVPFFLSHSTLRRWILFTRHYMWLSFSLNKTAALWDVTFHNLTMRKIIRKDKVDPLSLAPWQPEETEKSLLLRSQTRGLMNKKFVRTKAVRMPASTFRCTNFFSPWKWVVVHVKSQMGAPFGPLATLTGYLGEGFLKQF